MQNSFLRSSNRGNANNVWNRNTSGYINNNNANNSNRCAPDGLHTSDPEKPTHSDGGEQMKAGSLTSWDESPEPHRLLPPGTGLDFDDVINFDTLMDSMWKCKRGVTWKPSVSYFRSPSADRNA